MECGVIVLDMAHLERQEEEDILRLAILINYHLSQMFKLIEHGEFNHLTIIVTLPFMCGNKVHYMENLSFLSGI